MENNTRLTREQKMERFDKLNKRKSIKVTVDEKAYAEAFDGYMDFYNEFAVEFVAEDGRVVRECV